MNGSPSLRSSSVQALIPKAASDFTHDQDNASHHSSPQSDSHHLCAPHDINPLLLQDKTPPQKPATSDSISEPVLELGSEHTRFTEHSQMPSGRPGDVHAPKKGENLEGFNKPATTRDESRAAQPRAEILTAPMSAKTNPLNLEHPYDLNQISTFEDIEDSRRSVSSAGSRKRKRSRSYDSEPCQRAKSTAIDRSPLSQARTPRRRSPSVKDEDGSAPQVWRGLSSSLTPLGSHTPSCNTPIPSVQDGTSRERPLMIRSSLSPDMDSELISLSPSDSQANSGGNQEPELERGAVGSTDLRIETSENEKSASLDETSRSRTGPRSTASVINQKKRDGISNHNNFRLPSKLKQRDTRKDANTETSYKFSLKDLTRQNQRDSSAQEKIAAYRSAMETAETQPDHTASESSNMDTGLLATVVGDEDDESRVGKLVQAMERAEVLKTEGVWHFFEPGHQPEQMRCPSFSSLKEDSWLPRLIDEDFREQIFLSGCAGEFCSVSCPPEEALKWMLDAAVNDPREELSQRYLEALLASHQSGEYFVSTASLGRMLRRCGARPEALEPSAKTQPIQRHPNNSKPACPPQLLRIIKSLDLLAHTLSCESLKYALLVMLRLSIDASRSQTSDLKAKLRSCISSLFHNLHVSSASTVAELTKDLTSTIEHPTLAHRLLDSIPDTSPRLHAFKRHLALAFFLCDPENAAADLTQPAKLTKKIVRKLRKDHAFDITDKSVDYRILASYISLLDIAIAGGFDPPPPHISTARVHPRSSEAWEKEEEFNAQIDSISAEISGLSSRIKDTGASHLNKTQSKMVLERLKHRLDYGVRTRPRPSRTSVGATLTGKSGLSGDGRQRDMMRAFVKPEKREYKEGQPRPRPSWAGGGPVLDLEETAQDPATGTGTSPDPIPGPDGPSERAEDRVEALLAGKKGPAKADQPVRPMGTGSNPSTQSSDQPSQPTVTKTPTGKTWTEPKVVTDWIDLSQGRGRGEREPEPQDPTSGDQPRRHDPAQSGTRGSSSGTWTEPKVVSDWVDLSGNSTALRRGSQDTRKEKDKDKESAPSELTPVAPVPASSQERRRGKLPDGVPRPKPAWAGRSVREEAMKRREEGGSGG